MYTTTVIFLLIYITLTHYISSRQNQIKSYYSLIGNYRIYFSSLYPSKEGPKYLPINQQINATYLNDFDSQEPYTAVTDNITINSFNVFRRLLYKDIRFEAIDDEFDVQGVSVPLAFYDLQKNPHTFGYNFGISFALKPQNETFSLIHQFKNKGYTNKNILTFQPTTEKGGFLYMGDIPDEISYKSNKGECTVNGDVWGCDLFFIYFANQSNNKKNIKYNYINYYDAIFDSGEDFIYAPTEYLDYLKSSVFKEQFQAGECGYISHLSYNSIECTNSPNLWKNLPTYINFVLGNYIYSINTTKLFYDCGMNLMRLIIVEKTEGSYKERQKWIFGASFMHNYISSFDFDEKKITFYSDKIIKSFYNLNKRNRSVNRVFVILYWVLFIFLILGVINSILVCKDKKEKTKKRLLIYKL